MDAGAAVTVTASAANKMDLRLAAYANAGAVSAHALAFDTTAGTSHTTPTVTGDRLRLVGPLLLGGQVVLDDRVDRAGRADRAGHLDRHRYGSGHLAADRRQRAGRGRHRGRAFGKH